MAMPPLIPTLPHATPTGAVFLRRSRLFVLLHPTKPTAPKAHILYILYSIYSHYSHYSTHL
ncbi:MAG: hypothetical protein SOX83_05640 [Sodaliphilus sp.]|nr:hypothetical protein [Sodaliphilus sp.]